MAFIPTFNSKMVHWRFYVQKTIDFTNDLNQVLSSVKIKYSVNKPTEFEATVISKNYIEDIWTEGQPISFYIGYDRLKPPLAFDGRIMRIPDGSAKELLNYRIKAIGFEVALSEQEKNRTFRIPRKGPIIAQIASENGLTPYIYLQDNNVIPRTQVPIQRAQTDLQLLYELAERWNCLVWFEPPDKMYFIDAEKAHEVVDMQPLRIRSLRDSQTKYNLGYRTDQTDCNVESVSWTFKDPKRGNESTPGSRIIGPSGEIQVKDNYRIMYNGETWRLRRQYYDAAMRNHNLFGQYALAIARGGVSGAQTNLRLYYERVAESRTSNATTPPAHNAGGFEFKIALNQGDPYLRPPRNMLLYSGSLNPRADSADLPGWVYRHGQPAPLKLNEHTLSYDNGFLKSELVASMGYR